MKGIFKAIKEFFDCLIDGFRFLPILWGLSEWKEDDHE